MGYKRIITTAQVRRNLLGLQDELATIDPDDVETLLTESLDAAQNEFEQDLQTWLYTRKVVTYPAVGAVLGTDYDVVDDPYDYYAGRGAASACYNLRHRPVQQVLRMAVEYGPAQTLFVYPAAWIRLDHPMGQITILPNINQGSGMGLAPQYALQVARGGMLAGVNPAMVSIDYTAGIADADSNPTWALLRTKMAQAAGLLARDAIMESVVLTSGREGISTSYANGQQHAATLAQKIAEWKESFTDNNRPVMMRIG